MLPDLGPASFVMASIRAAESQTSYGLLELWLSRQLTGIRDFGVAERASFVSLYYSLDARPTECMAE